MPNALRDAVSPYLRSHADNPVDWRPWGPDAFAEAHRRGTPVLVSIGYSTCHWCHVMARESFSDPVLASRLNDGFFAIKVDREEHPDVDASYLAAAAAFTDNLGWPLTVFVTPEGRAFYAGTYFPPLPVRGVPSFSQVLDAVLDAWQNRRDEVEQNAAQIAAALAQQTTEGAGSVPSRADIVRLVADLGRFEDHEFGGFGGAPKFPVAPVQLLLLDAAAGGDETAAGLARRSLEAMAASPLRDAVEGGFFRYAVRCDWAEPHYERMLYDNAQLLRAYSRLSVLESPLAAGVAGAVAGIDPAAVAAGIADFLLTTLRTPEGGFGSAQDSESDLGEGGYYRLDEAARAEATPPAVDGKVLTGWNGLALGALAEAGARHARGDWLDAAVVSADRILRHHVVTGEAEGDGPRLVRAATSTGASSAVATLEDFGMLAEGLVRLSMATGSAAYAERARDLIDACMLPADDARGFAAPGDGDPVLAEQGLTLASDPSEGAYPSGLSAAAAASLLLAQLGAGPRYRAAAERAVASVSSLATANPVAFGAMLTVALDLADGATQLVVVTPDAGHDPGTEGEAGAGSGDLAATARRFFRPGAVSIAVSDAQAREWSASGFELFEERVAGPHGTAATAYVCHDFVCRLPVSMEAELAAQLG